MEGSTHPLTETFCTFHFRLPRALAFLDHLFCRTNVPKSLFPPHHGKASATRRKKSWPRDALGVSPELVRLCLPRAHLVCHVWICSKPCPPWQPFSDSMFRAFVSSVSALWSLCSPWLRLCLSSLVRLSVRCFGHLCGLCLCVPYSFAAHLLPVFCFSPLSGFSVFV